MSPVGPAGPASGSASDGDRIVVAGRVESIDYEDHIVVDGESAPMTPDEFVAWLQERPEYAPGVPVVLLAGDASVFAFAVAPLLDAPVTGPWGDFSPIPTGDLAAGTLLRDPDDELRIGDAPHDGWYTFGPDGDLVSRVRTLPDSGAFLRDQATAERVTGRPVGIWRSTTAPQKAAESPAPTPGGEETSHGAALAGDHPSEPGPEGGHAETVSLPSADQPETGTPVDRARATLDRLPTAQREGLLNRTDTIIREAITRPRTGQPRPRAPREWRLLVAAEIARSGEQAGENLAHTLVADNPPTRNSAAEPSTQEQTASRAGGGTTRLPRGPVVEGEYHRESFTVRIPGSDQDLDPEQTARWIEGNTTYGPGRPVILNIPGVEMPGPEGGPSFADLVATHLGGTVVVPRSSGLSIGTGWTTHRPGELPASRRLDPDHAWNRLLDPAISAKRRREALSQAAKLVEDRIRQVRPGENPRGAVSRPDEIVVLIAAEYLRGPRSAGALTNLLIPEGMRPRPTVAGPAQHAEADDVAAPLTETALASHAAERAFEQLAAGHRLVEGDPAWLEQTATSEAAVDEVTAAPLQPGTTRPGTVDEDAIEVVDAASDQVEAVPDDGLSRDPDLVREVNKVLAKTPQWTRGDVSEEEVAYWHGQLPRHWRLPGAYRVKDRAEATAALMVSGPLPRVRGGGDTRDSRAGSFQRTGRSSRAAVPAPPRHEAMADHGDDYHVLLIGVFGTRLLRDESSYMALRQAVRRLDDLRRSDPLIGGGAFDLDAVVRRVQVLDADVAVTEWQRRQVVQLAAGVGGQVDSLAEVAAHYLVEQGVLSGHRLRLPGGDAYGVNWLPYRAHQDLDVLTVDAVVREGDGTRRRRPATAAPWSPDGALPYAVLAEGGPEHLVMPVGEERRRVPADVVAEVLALDPLLAAEDGGLSLEVPGLLAVSGAGRLGLEFPRRIAHRTGRNFWSTSGELDLRSNVLTTVVRPGKPQGSWLLSRPDEVGPADPYAPDWTRHVVSHTVQVGGKQIRAAYRDAEYAATREDNLREIDRLDTYVHADPVSDALLAVDSPPVDWSYAYFAHGIPERIQLPLEDGTVRKVGYRAFARHGLSTRPSVRNLRKVTAQDDGQSLLLAPCWAGAPAAEPRPLGRHPGAPAPFVFDPLRTLSGAQEVANATRNMVGAPARPSGLGRAQGKLIYGQMADLAGNMGAWVVARPEPEGEDLDALARAAGLADAAPAPVSDGARERTLVLVRALRWQFGPHVDRDPHFGELVRGIGGLERMRQADPALSPFGGFTVHLLSWAARAYGELPGVAYSDAGDRVRQMLSWSGAVVGTQPGARLTEVLPGLTRLRYVAQDLLGRDASTAEATGRRLLRLDASEPFGEAEWSRLFWSMAEARQWLSGLSDPDALAARVLHLERPESGRRADFADLVVSAMAAGRDPDDTVQLGAFHLETLGAFAPDRELLDESGEPSGRNWSSNTTSGVEVRTSELMILQEAGPGRPGTTRQEPAPWSGGGGEPVLMLYTGRIGRTQVALTIGGTRMQVPYAEFAELVSRDPLLLTHELTGRDVVTVSSGVAADRPRLKRLSERLLNATGRTQWMFSNESALVPPGERGRWIGVFAAQGEDVLDQWLVTRPSRVDPASYAAVTGMALDADESDAASVFSDGESDDGVSVARSVTPADQAMRPAGLSPGERMSELQFTSVDDREALASDREFVRGLRQSLSPVEFASAVAQLMIRVPSGVEQPATARQRLHAILTRMLSHNADVAENVITAGGRVFIIPRTASLTSLGPWRQFVGDEKYDRSRGHTSKRTRSTAVPEENLLGEISTVGAYSTGHSLVTHEIAHLIHFFGLGDEDRKLISRHYKSKLNSATSGINVQWPDGPLTTPEGGKAYNYSATNELEYFAQLTSAYLGTNAGVGFATHWPRNNGADWVIQHEDTAIVDLLEKIYGPVAEGIRANPLWQTQAENRMYRAFREFSGEPGGDVVELSREADPWVILGEFDPAAFAFTFDGRLRNSEQTARWVARNTGYKLGDSVTLVPLNAEASDDDGIDSWEDEVGFGDFADELATHLGGLVVVADPAGLTKTTYRPQFQYLSADQREALASDRDFVHRMRVSLPRAEFAAAVADLMVQMPPGVERPATAGQRLRSIITTMLSNDPESAENVINAGGRVFIMPRAESLTSLGPWREFAGTEPVEGRPADRERSIRTGALAAVSEENLLGEKSLLDMSSSAGYSDAVHVFAQLLYAYGLNDEMKGDIQGFYNEKLQQPDAMWPGGSLRLPGGLDRPAENPGDYFAALTNFYLEAHAADSPYTDRGRLTGYFAVRQHDEDMHGLLQFIYGTYAKIENDDPPGQEDDRYSDFRAFWESVEEKTESPGEAPAPATATRPAVEVPDIEVPDIVIVPPGEEGGNGEHDTPADRITGTAEGGTRPDPRDELAELDPSATVPTPPRLPLRFSDVVAADEVWKYVIEARHHDAALAGLPSDPGGYYDNDKSPGYRAAMLRTFNEVFDREDPLHLDWNLYNDLHDKVTSGVEGDFERNGVGTSMGRFPLRATRPAPDILDEVIGGRRLISSYDQASTASHTGDDAVPLTVYQRQLLGQTYIYTLYESGETPALVDEVFDRFRAEVSSATTDLDRLIAIGRTIRALHVLHPYADGNLRLNVHVVLPYLLLSHGFHPVISEDLHAIFNGGYSLTQIASVLLRGQPSADTGGPVARQLPAPDLEGDAEAVAAAPSYQAMNRPDEGPRHPAPPAAGGPVVVELDDSEWRKSSLSEGDCVEVVVWR